jgi:hypothetical protein
LSRNLGTLTSWNPLGLSGPVMGLFYLLHTYIAQKYARNEILRLNWQQLLGERVAILHYTYIVLLFIVSISVQAVSSTCSTTNHKLLGVQIC